MTFAQAKKKLKKIADGAYHMLNYELTEYHTGEQKTECVVYIDGRGSHSGLTWEEAFKNLDRGINGQIVDASEQPKGQA